MRKQCKEPYYSQLASCRKTVEGRLNKEDWAEVKPGQKIEFFCAETNESFICEVVQVQHYKTFAELFQDVGQKLLPDVEKVEDAVAVYRKIYSQDDEIKYGVLGIVVKVL